LRKYVTNWNKTLPRVNPKPYNAGAGRGQITDFNKKTNLFVNKRLPITSPAIFLILLETKSFADSKKATLWRRTVPPAQVLDPRRQN